MKAVTLLPLAALSTAIVIPEQHVMSQIAIESHKDAGSLFEDVASQLPSEDEVFESIEETFESIVDKSTSVLEEAYDWAADGFQAVANTLEDEDCDFEGWLASAEIETEDGGHHHDGPHHPRRPGHGKRPGRRPRRPHKSNKTVYQLITESKYSTKLAKLISDDEELVSLLNSTSANFTVFVPIDRAFEKLPKPPKEPSKELIRKVLSYHISSDFYPAGRVLVTRTVPTLLEGEYLSHDPKSTPQRLSTNVGFRGLTVNYYSRLVGLNLFGSNGVIHAVDSLLFPPFKAAKAISFLPSTFSTLELGLVKTGLYPVINDTSNHLGGTLFAPSNFAFKKLGPRINAFLFSKYGQKYLKALLEYHISPNQTLYSDAFYVSSKPSEIDTSSIPKGKFHVDLPTLLGDRYLSIDVGRYGRLIDIRINGFQSVNVPDGIAKDGVIHVVNNVIVPPKKLGSGELQMYDGEELTVEDLKERLDPFVEAGDDEEELEEELEEGFRLDL